MLKAILMLALVVLMANLSWKTVQDWTVQVGTWRRVQNKPNILGGFRQTRLERLAAEKHRTISAGLMRKHGMRLEKTRKSLLAVARLQAGRGSRASLQADRTIRPQAEP